MSTKAAIIKISGCKDSQVSSDYYDNFDQEHQGALTNAFLDTNPNSIFSNRIKDINHFLSNKNFKQIPLLTVSNSELINWSLYDERFELII